jgi:amino acid transporter
VDGASAAFGIMVLGLTGVEQAATYSALVCNGRRTLLLASIGVLVTVTVAYLLATRSYQVFYGDKTPRHGQSGRSKPPGGPHVPQRR